MSYRLAITNSALFFKFDTSLEEGTIDPLSVSIIRPVDQIYLGVVLLSDAGNPLLTDAGRYIYKDT